MIRKEKFVSGEYYHVYSRVILGMPEFSDKDNALRLAQTFLLANSTSSSKAFDFIRNNRKSTLKEAIEISKSGEKLSEILCYAIMPNHYHLLVKEIRDNGITDFIRRCNTAIAKYIKYSSSSSKLLLYFCPPEIASQKISRAVSISGR